MKIAIIGTGIAGLGAAHYLYPHHQLTLFEQNASVGGHSHTVTTQWGETTIPVDTGFMVYNTVNYPNLCRLFDELHIAYEETDMSFAVDSSEVCYSSRGWQGLFADRRNLIRPLMWRMLYDILRFYQIGQQTLQAGTATASLGDFLNQHRFSKIFIERHIAPMGAAIWSTTQQRLLAFPVLNFLRFLNNHGLLAVGRHLRWRTVSGGSVEYVKRLTAPFAQSIQTNCGINRVLRQAQGVTLITRAGAAYHFDAVLIAAHAPQALAMLGDNATPTEQRLLSAFMYEPNSAVLHSDPSFMPRHRAAWASWNYLATGNQQAPLMVTYHMNRLQNIPERYPLFVTLNPQRPIAASLVHRTILYEHPLFNDQAMQAQQHLPSLQGLDRVWFAGSYFGYGFHEDAYTAGLNAARHLHAAFALQAAA